MDAATRAALEHSRDYAREKIAAGTEPPWMWYEYMKLDEAVRKILNDKVMEIPTRLKLLKPTTPDPPEA